MSQEDPHGECEIAERIGLNWDVLSRLPQEAITRVANLDQQLVVNGPSAINEEDLKIVEGVKDINYENGRLKFYYLGQSISIDDTQHNRLAGVAHIVNIHTGSKRGRDFLLLDQDNNIVAQATWQIQGTRVIVEYGDDRRLNGVDLMAAQEYINADANDKTPYMKGGVASKELLELTPLVARARLRKIYLDHLQDEIVKNTIETYNLRLIPVIDLIKNEVEFLGFLKAISKVPNAEGKRLGEVLVRGVGLVSAVLPDAQDASNFEHSKLHDRIVEKFKKMIKELEQLASGDLNNDEIQMVSISFEALYRLGYAAFRPTEQSTVRKEDLMPPKWDAFNMKKALDFWIKKDKLAPNIGQIVVDFVHSVQIASQPQDVLDEIRMNGEEYYRRTQESDAMNEGTVSTDTETDRARLIQLISYLVDNGSTSNLNILFAGLGTGARLEWPVLEQLIKSGKVHPSRVAGIDSAISEGQVVGGLRNAGNFEFHKADITNKEFMVRLVENGEKFDLMTLPWSVFNDIVSKKDVAVAHSIWSKVLKPGGVVIMDIPISIDGIYKELTEQFAKEREVLGIVDRQFPIGGGQTMTKTVNIMMFQEILYLAHQAGFEPANLDGSILDIMDRYQADCGSESGDKLSKAHESNEDHDPVEHPFWQTRHGLKRATLAFRYVGQMEDEQDGARYSDSLLLARLLAE